MQTIGIAATIHETAGEFINDNDFPVLDHIVFIASHHSLCTECLDKEMIQLQILCIIEVLYMQQLFHLCHTGFGRCYRLLLLIDGVVFLFFQLRDEFGDGVVCIGRFLPRTGNDQRRAGFIDQDGVHFIDQAVVERTLYHLIEGSDHVITQVIKTEFIVRPVGDIRIVRDFSLVEIQVVNDETDGEAKEFVYLSHPFAVSFRQIIIDGNNVDALSFQRIQIDWCRSDQRLAFTGTHLSDVSTMQNNTTNQLGIEVTHPQHAAGGFTNDRKSLWQDIIQCLTLGKTRFKFIGFVRQRRITQLLQTVLQRIDLLLYNFADLFDFLLIGSIEESVKKLIKHGHSSFYSTSVVKAMVKEIRKEPPIQA